VGICFYTGWLILLGLLNRQVIRAIVRNPALLDEGISPADLRPFLQRSWISLIIGVGAFAAGMVTWIAALVVLMIGAPLIALLVARRAARRADA
ncbi:hypothetical protein ACTGVN_10750, partial [Streptococcus suis]